MRYPAAVRPAAPSRPRRAGIQPAAGGSAGNAVTRRPVTVRATAPSRPRAGIRPAAEGPAGRCVTPCPASLRCTGRRAIAFALTVAWTAGSPGPAAGAACPAAPDPAARAAFVEAERSPPKGQNARERLRERLGDYPLLPYVEYARLRKALHRVPAREVEAFLGRYEGAPVADRLRSRWLHRLAGKGEWEKFIEWYPGSASAGLRCRYARALLAAGDEDGAFAEAQALWMSGKSRPKACDPVFAVWLESSRFSPELAWERIELAMARGNVRLVRYLERFLDPADRRLAGAWREVHGSPQRVGAIELEGEPLRVEAVRVHGLERFARRDPAAAAGMLARVEERFRLGAVARAAAERAIGLAFAYRHDPRAVEWLGRIDPAYADVRLLGWRVSAAALHGRWDEVAEGVALMPEEERARERWRYWRARALEAAGRVEEARAGFESLAGERDYYGFLAADRLETGYRFNHRPLAVAADTVERVAAMPAVRRALELLALGRRVEARREWRALTRGLGGEELKAASWIARCRDWHARAILTIARTTELDDLDLRFPLAFRRAVESPSVRRSLPPAAVYAVIRQESAFMSDARSSAGALGLMQIMPRTGREIARAMGRRLRNRNELLVPRLNVEMGTHYLRSLLREVDGHIVLATASYNAGPHRVRRWLPAQGEVEAAVWIDSIPFTETRRYVRRVLAYHAIYEHRLGQRPTRLSERMPPVPSRAAL